MFIKSTGQSYNRRTLIELFLTERPATYDDESCTKENCRKGAYRSITDLLSIVRTYFPKTSMNDVLKIITTLIDKDQNIALIWCTQVKKVVLKYDTRPAMAKEYATKYSKNNYDNTKGEDGYSISDYRKLIKNL